MSATLSQTSLALYDTALSNRPPGPPPAISPGCIGTTTSTSILLQTLAPSPSTTTTFCNVLPLPLNRTPHIEP
ncbi:hypothetical protein V496_01519 [Pseudogymnoascus sp. VKM F-4515 (FW-2607)]|nr:hypothetical protein V496_01519 [Pseudogymnoascus sp. VKM F-4515 (FW-2607)]